jgi:AcrR family transcriptional regulator
MSANQELLVERRRQILEAAAEVFARLGIQKARMDDIVEASGLSKGSLYWYFDSKDDIIIGIVKTLLDQELEKLESMRAAQGAATDRLLAFLEVTLDDLTEMWAFIPIFFEFYAMAMRSEEIQSLFQNYFRSYMDILTPIIQQGIDQGEFRPVEAQKAAIALGALIEGTILLKTYGPETVDLREHMETGVRLLLTGLRKEG